MTDGQARVFLDANVLAKPITRSLLMFASDQSAFEVVWSAHAEREADRHLGGSKKPMAEIRAKAEQSLSPTGSRPKRFAQTAATDRQILADAEAAKAQFIITEDVDDFAADDLAAAGVAAVNPDLFLAERATLDGYVRAVRVMAAAMTDPARTPEELHARLGRQHPRTTAEHSSAYASRPLPPTHNQPAVLFRGSRCLHCLRVSQPLILGVCHDCREDRQRTLLSKL
ncbi:MAG: hypothetical protein LBK42_06430 [Propionibacteriaceae bacterium]|jgi:hypothetical protein|nr:hypothetical protein [Propionibacteriaceae bacterium]